MAFWIRPVKIHIDYICDFIFDDERLENIYLIDKKESHAQ